MLRLSSILASILMAVVLAGSAFAQDNPYAVETKIIKNEQGIANLRQQQANLYLKMEDLLVKYGELKGRLEDMAHRLDIIESRLNSLGSVSKCTENNTPAIPQSRSQPLSNQAKPAPVSKLPANQVQKQIATKAHSNVKPAQNVEKAVSSAKKVIQKKKTIVKKSPAKKTIAAQTTLETDKKAFIYAKKLYDEKHYNRAIQAFETFKRQYGNSKYMPDAIFYSAQSHFAKKEYDKAIIGYDYLVNTYPKSSKVPAALLNEGISFIKLGDNIDGKYLLQKTVREYPTSKEASIAKQYLKKIK